MRKLSEKVLGLVAPGLVAEAGECQCEGNPWSYSYFCGCNGIWATFGTVRCDGCRITYSSCVGSNIRC